MSKTTKFLICVLIAFNILAMVLICQLVPAASQMTKIMLMQTELIQQAHERLDVLERLLRVNTTPAPSRGNVTRQVMTATAYTAGPESTGKHPGHPAYGVTSTGYRLTDADAWRVAAADPAYYPPGTRIYVAGVGVVTVRDTGAAVKGPDNIDIFVGMTDVAVANAWGVQAVPAAVIGGGT